MDYEKPGLDPQAFSSHCRFLRDPKGVAGDDPNKGKYQFSVPATGGTVFRTDSLLSLICVMRGFPSGAEGVPTIGQLGRGFHSQALYTDESIASRVYCYGSVYAAADKIGNSGKYCSHNIPTGGEFNEFATFLNHTVLTVQHAASIKAGPQSKSDMQWAKCGFLSGHGYTKGVIIPSELHSVAQELQRKLRAKRTAIVIEAVGRVLFQPFIALRVQDILSLCRFRIAGGLRSRAGWILSAMCDLVQFDP